MTRAAFLICLIAGAVCLIYSNVLGMLAAHKLAMQALSARALLHKNAEKFDESNECIAIIYDVLKPLWMDASREASGMHVAALENQA